MLFFFGWEDCGQIPFQVDVIEVREQRNLCAEGRLQRRLGSTAALTSPKADFRSLPKSGLKSAIAVGPFRANSEVIRPRSVAKMRIVRHMRNGSVEPFPTGRVTTPATGEAYAQDLWRAALARVPRYLARK